MDAIKLWLNSAFYLRKENEESHLNDETLANLNRVIDSVRKIPTSGTRIIIDSSDPIDVDAEVRIHDSSWKSYELTWKHKSDLLSFLESDFTHFVYIENDMLFTEGLFNYWLRNRQIMKEYGFIPSFLRIEYNEYGVPFCVDVTWPQTHRPKVLIDGNKYLSLDAAYHGMMVMDREMVQKHINSPGFTWETSLKKELHGYPESANCQYMYEDVPYGYDHRMLVPLDNVQECCIHHLPNKYVNNSFWLYGTLPLSRLFENMDVSSNGCLPAIKIMENDNIIEQKYNERRVIPSDINEHLETLYNYALKCETIAELGVRFVVSSYAFAHAKPKRLLCLDICHYEEVDKFKEECRAEGVNMEFVLANSLDYELDEDFDMLFIDTIHNYSQVKGEIEKHHSKIKKYMILHDTITFGNKDAIGEGPGLIKAINEFLYANSDWRQLEFHTNNNGLTILERVSGK